MGDNKYDVDGFCRRVRSPVVDEEIISISSGDESNDSNRTFGLNDLEVHELEVKREQILCDLGEHEANETGENDFELDQANAIAEPMYQNVSYEQNAMKTPINGMDTHGGKTPESLGKLSNLSSGIGSIQSIANNYDNISEESDDFLLDLPQPRHTEYNGNQQMNNVSTTKIQFRMKSEKSNQNISRVPLQDLSENVIQHDDTTQMVPDAANQNYNSMFPDQRHEQFSMDNLFDDQFTTSATPLYTPLHQSTLVSIKDVYEKIKEENEREMEEQRERLTREIEASVLKKIEEKGLALIPMEEYSAWKKEQNAGGKSSRNGDRHSNKRRSMSPNGTSEKKQKSSHHSHHERHRSSSSSKHDGHRDYHRSSSMSSNSSKIEKSARKTSTVTSGSYQPFQNDSNPNGVYEHDTSSNSSVEAFKWPSVEKEKPPHASNSGVQSKYKSNFGKEGSFMSSSGKATRSLPFDQLPQQKSRKLNQQNSGTHHAHKKADEQNTRETLKKNTDKSLYLNSDKAKDCPICCRPYKRMVSHLKSNHNDHEVYVSRVSPKMAEKINHGKIRAVKYVKGKSQLNVKALCVFCEVEKDFMPNYFKTHYRSHTGEYAYECNLCLKRVCFPSHCGMPACRVQDTDDTDLYREDLCARICRMCNYVQIDQENMRIHLRDQHEINDASDYEKCYKKIVLLPAIKRIPITDLTSLPGTSNTPNVSRFFEEPVQPQREENPSAPTRPRPSSSGITVLENRVIRPAVSETEVLQSKKMEIVYDENDIPLIEQNVANNITHTTHDTTKAVENAYKIDPATENALYDAFNNYDHISEYNYAVRPWIPDDYAKKLAIYVMTQFALYKCMHAKCLYATNNVLYWEEHMSKHIDMMDVLNKRGLMFTKETREAHIKFRECPYCTNEEKANFKVIAHMEEHCRNAFQCAHCFYRSIEMDSIVLHYKMYHADKVAEILLCHEDVEFDQKDEEELQNNCHENIMKIRCIQDHCQEEYACINSLWAHVKVCHSNEDDCYTCPFCLNDIKCTESDIWCHLQEHFDATVFNEYQCIYCKGVGFSDINKIREHMSDAHASNFLFIAARRSAKPEDDEGEPQIVYIGNSQNCEKLALYKCANAEALERMDPTKLLVTTQFEVLKEIQNVNIKEAFTGRLPSIKFVNTKSDFYITYDDYLRIRRQSHRAQSTFQPVNQATEMQRKPSPAKVVHEVQNVQPQAKSPSRQPVKCERKPSPAEEGPENVQLQMKTPSHQPPKFEPLNQVKCDPNLLRSATATVQPAITYKCINIEIAKDLESIESRTYKSQLCNECTHFIKIDENTGLAPYISHLMENKDHPCTESSYAENVMLQHRIKAHGDSPIVYLQEEKTPNTLVYKLVSCKFKCLQCQQELESVSALKKHHLQVHLDRFLRSVIVQKVRVIQSNDPEQSVGSYQNVVSRFHMHNLFWCNRHGCTKSIGTRVKAIQHHNEKHPKHNFEFSIKLLLIESLPEQDDHGMFVLECEHCSKLFGTTESANAHIKEIRSENSETAFYTLQRLLVCPVDKIVSTLNGLGVHYSAKHPEKTCTPVHLINPKMCGLCRDTYVDIGRHYKTTHQKGEVFGNTHLKNLNVHNVDLDECIFAAGCCSEVKRDEVSQIIHHITGCKHRLKCDECSELTFERVQDLAMHRKNVHMEKKDQILHYVHDIKKFRRLLFDMKIIFPQGFITTNMAIEDTNFGVRLGELVNSAICNAFEREKLYLDTLF